MVTAPSGRGGQQALWVRPFSWLWAKRAWVAGAVGVVFLASTLYVLWAVHDLPDPSQDVLAAGDVVVLDRNGKLIEDWNPNGHYHVNVGLHDMGPYAANAVLAAEDRNFYSHGAIDRGAVARALWVDVTSRGLNEGGSTITQQLVKIQLLTPTKSINRKVSTAAVKPKPEQTMETIDVFRKVTGQYLDRVGALPDLNSSVRHEHPWFGPLNAHGWHVLAAVHHGIHRRQIEWIIATAAP